MKKFSALIVLSALLSTAAVSNEVLEKTPTEVTVREHPRTGKPYVVIIPAGINQDPLAVLRSSKPAQRPDYRLLDPKVRSGQVPYEGPVSDRKKVYIFAASIATIGVVGGAGIIAAAPAASGAGAAGGAGLYAGVGAGIAAGTIGGTYAAMRTDPSKESFKHVSESREVKTTFSSAG